MDARCAPVEPATQAQQRVVIRPNRSLSLRAMIWLFVAYLGLTLVVGLGFMQLGAWMILPFAGLEAVIIGAIFYYLLYRYTDDHELVIVDGDELSVIKHEGKAQSRYEFQRYWTRISLEPSGHAWYPSRLMVGSHGHLIELGSGLREADRQVVAGKLKDLMGRTAYT